MLELDVAKPVGADGISPWILNEGAEVICLPLSVVYNKPLETGDLAEI